MNRKIYLASSWRNSYYTLVLMILQAEGHEVYDFRHPGNDLMPSGFNWSEIDANWKNWTTNEYREALNHPIAKMGFKNDFDAMKWADTCVLLLPCGRSAHSEAGWMKGAGKQVFVFIPEKQEPELMYKLYDEIITDPSELYKLKMNFEELYKLKDSRQ